MPPSEMCVVSVAHTGSCVTQLCCLSLQVKSQIPEGRPLTHGDCCFSSSILRPPQTSLSLSPSNFGSTCCFLYVGQMFSLPAMPAFNRKPSLAPGGIHAALWDLSAFLEGWEGARETLSARSVFMLMLLNSRSVMKASLGDLIEVSVGQMRGFHPSIQSFIHQTSTELAQGRRQRTPWFLPSG